MQDIMQLCDVIRETGFPIHRTIGTDTWRRFMRMHSFTDSGSRGSKCSSSTR